MKRIFALFLCLALLAAAAPRTAAAKAVSDTEREMNDLANKIFSRCQQTSGRTSFHGYCGNFVSHQLYNLRINKRLYTTDGNKHYDYYAKLKKTTGGYYTKAYDARDFSLLGALNEITRYGTRDVFNILVGFQWTNTEAGNKYGHVVLIYGIVDGVVYFAESFPTGFTGYRPEGSLIKCSIVEFFNAYDNWTQFEGCVVFGVGNYSDGCEEEGTDLILQARFDTTLRSAPSVPDKNDCKILRPVSAGERLHATGVLFNTEGQYFYRITGEGEQDGFVAAGAVAPIRANAQDLQLDSLEVAQSFAPGEDAPIAGAVIARRAEIASVEVSISDEFDQEVFLEQMDTRGFQANLSGLNELLRLDLLEVGGYSLRIFANVVCPTAYGGTLLSRACLGGQDFRVEENAEAQEVSAAEPVYLPGYIQQEYDGWIYDDGWYFYREDKPLTGWFQDRGVTYCADDTGRVYTDWQSVDGQLYFFSATGALVTDCTRTNEDTVYQLGSDGTARVIQTGK